MRKSLKYLGVVFFIVLAQFSVLGQEAQGSTIDIIANEGFTFNTLWRGILGMMCIMLVAYIFSSNRKAINWKTVGAGLSAQLLLAIGVLKISLVRAVFEFVGNIFVQILDFTRAGSEFLFGGLMNIESYGFIFVFQILPTIIFFSALTSFLFYVGFIQIIVRGMAWIMTKLMYVSGPESLSVAGNIFLGQTESPLMIKAYLEKMTKSELLLVMVGGMATVAGGVLAAYIGFLGGDDPVQRLIYAKHLLAASVMAAPGAIVVSKMLFPETENIVKDLSVSHDKIGSNVLDAISNGTTEGLKLAANVAAMLLVFVAFIAMINGILAFIGDVPIMSIEGNENILTLLNEHANWQQIKAIALASEDFTKVKSEILNVSSLREITGAFEGTNSMTEIKNIISNYDNMEEKWFSLNTWMASSTPYSQFSLEAILGTIFAPFMWLIGVAKDDVMLMGQLLGIKLAASEFIGYIQLAELKNSANEIHFSYQKSVVMATYMLCGFANFASIGIQIGGIGSLAPSRRPQLAQFGMKALLGGTLASLLSATLVGMILG